MTLYDFKQELYLIRDNRRVMRSLRTSLASLEDDVLTSVFSGAVDYSKDRIQSSPDPDSAIINAILLTDKEKTRLKAQLAELQEENAEMEKLIYSQRGIGAEIVRLYFIEGETMISIAKRLNYHRDTCYGKWNETIAQMWKEHEEKQNGEL